MTTSINNQFLGTHREVVICNATAEGAETNAIKVDKSNLTGPNGLEPSKLRIDMIEWSTDVPITVFIDDYEVARLAPGESKYDFRSFGGVTDSVPSGAGDINFSTTGTGNYSVILHIYKKN